MTEKEEIIKRKKKRKRVKKRKRKITIVFILLKLPPLRCPKPLRDQEVKCDHLLRLTKTNDIK